MDGCWGPSCRTVFSVVSRGTKARPLPVPPAAPTVEIAPGVRMPLVSLGTARATLIEADVKTALSLGYVGIDTAHASAPGPYNDTAVGAALRGAERSSFFLTTKIESAYFMGLPVVGGCAGKTLAECTTGQLEASLANLGLDAVDLMLIHHPGHFKKQSMAESVQQQWAALEAFHKAGKARAIGVSNFCRAALEALLETATVRPAVNQVLYHSGMGPDPDGIVSLCRQHNMTLMAFSPTDEGNPVLLHGEPYATIGAAHNKSALQSALRWLVQRGHAYVVASDKAAYQREDIDVFDFALTDDEMRTIDAQASCQAGGYAPPTCLPYWPGPMDCCATDTNGTVTPQCAA